MRGNSEFLSRERYREIKKMNRNEMQDYIRGVYKLGLSDGAKDVLADTTFPKLDEDKALEEINKVLHTHASIAVGGKRFAKMREDLQLALTNATMDLPVGTVEIEEVKEREEDSVVAVWDSLPQPTTSAKGYPKLLGVDLAKGEDMTSYYVPKHVEPTDLTKSILELTGAEELNSHTKALIEICEKGAHCPYCGEALGKTNNVSNFICSVCGDVRGLPMECYTLQVKTRYTVQQIGARGKVWREPVNYIGKKTSSPDTPSVASQGMGKYLKSLDEGKVRVPDTKELKKEFDKIDYSDPSIGTVTMGGEGRTLHYDHKKKGDE